MLLGQDGIAMKKIAHRLGSTPLHVYTGSDSLTIREWLDSLTFEQGWAFGNQAVQNKQSGVWP